MYNLHPGIFLHGHVNANAYKINLICTYVNTHLLDRPDANLLLHNYMIVFFTYMYFWSSEWAANIHTYMQM